VHALDPVARIVDLQPTRADLRPAAIDKPTRTRTVSERLHGMSPHAPRPAATRAASLSFLNHADNFAVTALARR
jgi:hypothetical protein